jgi:hypothetical protein
LSILHQDQTNELINYVCENPDFQPNNIDQLIKISDNTQPSSSSADYCSKDFVTTDISVVLETVAADTKIHLTEKTLRPIACGHPFMLVAGPGALDYLKSYGFKTFSPYIDESYDQEPDIAKRLQLVAKEMVRIQNLDSSRKTRMFRQLKKIANYNKKHFFSNNFFNSVHQELINNLSTAVDQVKITRGQHYRAKKLLTDKHIPDTAKNRNKSLVISKILRELRKNPKLSIPDHDTIQTLTRTPSQSSPGGFC